MENAEKRHSLTIDGRKRGIISGVSKVVSASAIELCLQIGESGLSIRGKDLKISAYSEDSGSLTFEGAVDRLEYDKAKQPLLKRLFK